MVGPEGGGMGRCVPVLRKGDVSLEGKSSCRGNTNLSGDAKAYFGKSFESANARIGDRKACGGCFYGFGFVTLRRMKSFVLVPMGTLKVCCGGEPPVLPVAATGIQLPARSV